MNGAIDLAEFLTANQDLLVAVGTVGSASVALYVATQTFPFINKWVRRLFGNASGTA
jgi:hypothetical protein